MKTYITHPLTALIVGGFLIGLGVDTKMLSIALPGGACVFYAIVMGLKWVIEHEG